MLCVITSFMLLYVEGGSFMDELLLHIIFLGFLIWH